MSNVLILIAHSTLVHLKNKNLDPDHAEILKKSSSGLDIIWQNSSKKEEKGEGHKKEKLTALNNDGVQ